MHSLQVAGLNTNYQRVGKGPLLILLHGWANTWEAWLPIIPQLSENYTLIIPDLPGFGRSQGPQEGWSTHFYSLWLQEFLEKISIEFPNQEFTLIGHSFGGKIAAYYASHAFEPSPNRLVLIDASGIPGKLSSKQRALKLMSRSLPPFLKKTITHALRSRIYKAFDADSDYLNANESQRKTLKKILTENLTSDLAAIETPTLILWGNNDTATPISAGKIFNQQIEGSVLKTFDAEHFPHHQHPEKVTKTIVNFLKRKLPEIPRNPKYNKRKMELPLTTLLALLQQAEYEWPRFADWLALQKGMKLIEPKKWTGKLKLLRLLTNISRPLIGVRLSLYLWNGLIKFPQRIFFALVIFIAKLKLRFLQFLGLQVVAIAGSYAKTSTKFLLNHAISGLTPTLMTPDNINTPYGIARVIISQLNPRHRIFIAELGEYYPGDIAQLTGFLKPAFKILTPVGFAHLERFGTAERLEKGLLELITDSNTLSFVHENNEKLIEKHKVSGSFVFYGENNLSETSVTRAGTEFTVMLPESTKIFLPLLGVHNAVNALPALLLGDQLGFDAALVAKKLRTAPQIPHRLEPTLLTNNIFLIDNGYNSNPGSAKESLAVLDELEGNQKIVITPGFVEMGEDQEKENIALGQRLADFDLVGIVNGANEAALLTGLEKEKFNRKNIIIGNSELEIMNSIQEKIKPNAVILFENSITDVYKRS